MFRAGAQTEKWFVINASARAVLGEGPIAHSSSAILVTFY